MRKKKILITGAAGYIGSSLLKNLGKAIDPEVLLIDSFESQQYSSLFDLPTRFKYKLIKSDITSVDFAKTLNGVDIVIHLAASRYINKLKTKDIQESNFLGTKSVAEACLSTNTALLFPSTTSVYGSKKPSVDETCKELTAQSPHASEKLKCEQYLQKLGKKGLRYAICRFGTISGYSIGMRFDTAVNKFIWQAVTGEPLTVWKTAIKQKRPYLHLDDCIKAVNFIITNDLFDGDVYNVVSENLTVSQIVKEIKLCVREVKVSYTRSPLMNDLSYRADDRKIRSLGFKPEKDVKMAIGHSIKHLKGLV